MSRMQVIPGVPMAMNYTLSRLPEFKDANELDYEQANSDLVEQARTRFQQAGKVFPY
jgi:hypothetical protein